MTVSPLMVINVCIIIIICYLLVLITVTLPRKETKALDRHGITVLVKYLRADVHKIISLL